MEYYFLEAFFILVSLFFAGIFLHYAQRPGNKGRLCYLAQPSGHRSWYFRQKIVPVARQVWRAFCCPGANFIAFWRGRDTCLIDGREIVPVDEIAKGHWRSVAV